MKSVCSLLFFVLCSIGSAQVVTSTQGHKIMIFGGDDHKTYLGCLSCNNYQSDSVLNKFGAYGSRFQSESIFNTYGSFGSRYSSNSPCNPYASDPTVIVDEDGNFYGRLTVNLMHPQLVRNESLQAWIKGVCAKD